MNKLLRWFLGILLVLTVVAIATVIGLRVYLTSSQVAGQAAEQLSTTLKVPVRVRSADVGLAGSSSLQGVQLFESEEAERPWAEVEEAEADVSALGLAGGDTAPTLLTLRGAAVELHFAADGRLLTRLPLTGSSSVAAVPRVRLVNGRLTLRQDGREPMVLHGINAVLEPAADGLQLKGTVSDPEWGEWQIDGGLTDARQVHLHLTTPRTHFTPSRLATLPFVPRVVWEQVRAEGEAAADVTLRFGADGKDAHYRMVLDVLAGTTTVTAVGLPAEKTTGRIVIDGARVELKELTGQVAGGQVVVTEGELDFRKTPASMTFAFTGRDLDPRKLPEAWKSDGPLGETLKSFDGELRLHGQAKLRVTVDEVGKIQTSGEGEAELTGLILAGKEAKITLKLDLGNRVRFSAAAQPLPLLMTALHADMPVSAASSGYVELNLSLQDVDLSELIKELKLDLPLALAGRLSFQVKVALPLSTPRDLKTYRLEGTATLPKLELAGITFRAVKAKIHYAEGVLHLDTLTAELPELGKATEAATIIGTARVPIELAKAVADLEFANLNVSELTRTLPELPLKLEGKGSGKLRLEVPSAVVGQAPDLTANLSMTEGQLRIQNIPTRKLQGALKYREGALQYELEGEALGGKFQLDGKVPSQREKSAPKSDRSSGRLRVERAELSRLWEALRFPALATLSGRFDLDLPFTLDPEGNPIGRGRFLLSSLRLAEASLAEDLRGDVLLEDDALDVRDVSGRVAGGLGRLRLRYNLSQPERSFFTLSLERAESAVLLRPLQGNEEHIRGPANLQLRGRLGREWSARGEATLLNGEVLGAAVSEWRLPLQLTLTPVHGRGELVVTDSHGEVGRGRVNGRATLRWGGVQRLEGTLRFNRVEARELMGGSNSSLFGSGRVSGRFDFRADNLRSVNDLSGVLEASLDDAQALRLPVLREVARYVAPGQSSARFDSGDVHGRLNNGVFRLQRLTLANAYLQLVLEGTVTLSGRLNLETTARTGNVGVDSTALRLLGLQLPMVGPIPLGLINEVSNFLSNRIVHLQITGTTRSPVVRVNPVRFLTEEAVRFFLTRALLPIP